ncbi:MAG TPA: XRE family transcriptional regulator [Candidatus Barnesiella merdigallinarum]|nr:XRE family transcriptional regulator [Candidatus Barnesiella merdigallinarum]
MHIGNRIRDILKEREQSVVWLAHQLSYSRTNIYKLFDKSTIDTGVLLRISLILRHDFFTEYSNEIKAKQK